MCSVSNCPVVRNRVFSEVPHRLLRMSIRPGNLGEPGRGQKITQRRNTAEQKLGTEHTCFWDNFIHKNVYRQIRQDFYSVVAKLFFRNLVLNLSYISSKWTWALGKFEQNTRRRWGRSFGRWGRSFGRRGSFFCFSPPWFLIHLFISLTISTAYYFYGILFQDLL